MEAIVLENICELTIDRYFETLNAKDFQSTSELFAAEGVLQAPFAEPVMTPPAIAAYLHEEAQGITAHPNELNWQSLDDGHTQVRVFGQAKTPMFAVNVCWEFTINPEGKILLMRLKLLASPRQLLQMRESASNSTEKGI
jgi:hypothetical protein